MRVFLSDDEERKLVHDEDENFIACYAHGQWFDKKVVDTTTMKELDQDESIYEVGLIVRQARKALYQFY